MDTKKAKTNGMDKLVTNKKIKIAMLTDIVINFLKSYNYKQLNILAVMVIDSIVNNVPIRNSLIFKPLIAVLSGLKSDVVVNNNTDDLKAIITDILINGKKHKNKDARNFYTADACNNLNDNYTRKATAVISNGGILASGKDVPARDVKWCTKDTYKVLCNMPADYWQQLLAIYCKFNGLNLKDTKALIQKNLSKDNKDNKIQDYSIKAYNNAKTA